MKFASYPLLDDGFIGVERMRNRTKQLFLTGIAENVKEYQIQSYLEDRDVTYSDYFIPKQT